MKPVCRVFYGAERLPLSQFSSLLPLLPKERREKIESFAQKEDKLRSLVAYLCLAECDRARTGKVRNLSFCDPPNRLQTGEFCSISHTKGAVCAVLSDEPVGIDVQNVRPFRQELAEFTCSKEELAELEGLSTEQKAERFTEFWVKKESFLKLCGRGIGANLKTLSYAEVEFFTGKQGEIRYAVCQKKN